MDKSTEKDRNERYLIFARDLLMFEEQLFEVK